MQPSTYFRPDLRRYWIAGITAILAISAAQLLRPWVGQSVPPIVLAPWILIGAWYGGLGAGLLSTALNSIAAAYFLLPPVHSFRIAEPDDRLHLATLALVGVLISYLCESRRRTALRLESAVLEAQHLRTDARDCARRLADADGNLKYALNALLENLQGPAAELEAVVQGLAAYSSLADGAKRIEPIDVRRLAASAVEEFGALPETTHIVCDVPPAAIAGDESQLRQLFRHVIGNAIKFRSGEQLRIRISAEERSDRFIFSIADNGIGLIPAHWEQAFALGRRLHGDKYPGAGMGLALAKRIVENHGGRIWLISESGQGTTVRFTIPRKAF
ncbi:MAG TPA: sensor histidine kinase [Bryobacteraceae bacterium]